MRVKTGQVAYLRKCRKSENLGKVCEVGKFVGNHLMGYEVYENAWEVHFPNGVRNLLGKKVFLTYAPDDWLTPISDPDADLNEEIYKSIDCEVLT